MNASGGTLLHHPLQTMKLFANTFFLYIAAGAVIINVVGNMAANTADGVARAHEARAEQLCQVNDLYC